MSECQGCKQAKPCYGCENDRRAKVEPSGKMRKIYNQLEQHWESDGHIFDLGDLLHELELEITLQELSKREEPDMLAFKELGHVESLIEQELGMELNDSFKRGWRLARMTKKEFETMKEGKQ